ncbi:ABC transporter ATPase [Clostridium botulinum]|uniref:ABC transporter ATPase n=1 Tax=Clostridium botulinum TaxID=1491 RepID=UPI000A1730BC|nr:ABC transporter ATPase [Clostridium botulinum]OSA84097.1 ABC transporter ATPase [Clostridium botulinum]
MKELSTIQKKEKLNRVFAVDEIGPGGANHEYMIVSDTGLMEPKETIVQFQCGPRKEENSKHGVIDGDLLEIVRDRLQAFQAGPFASEYNAHALKHIEKALMWLNRRVEDRIERNVLGTNNK